MTNPVNVRLGRRKFTANAQRKKVKETCERIERECPPKHWKRDLTQSIREHGVIDDDAA